MIHATCHPDRKHYALGLCASCYKRSRRQVGKEVDHTKKERQAKYNQSEKRKDANRRYYLRKLKKMKTNKIVAIAAALIGITSPAIAQPGYQLIKETDAAYFYVKLDTIRNNLDSSNLIDFDMVMAFKPDRQGTGVAYTISDVTGGCAIGQGMSRRTTAYDANHRTILQKWTSDLIPQRSPLLNLSTKVACTAIGR